MKYKSVVIHLCSWLIYSGLIYSWHTGMFDSSVALIFTLRILFVQVLVFYINLFYLLPHLYARKNYLSYTLSVFILTAIIVSVFYFIEPLIPTPNPRFLPRFLAEMTFKNVPDIRKFPKPPTMRGAFFGRSIFGAMFNVVPFLFFSTLIWMDNDNRKRKQREMNLMNESLHSEMRFLKSQINPHFLFNALNNIYSLSYRKNNRAPQMILQLSEMLRYVIYETMNSITLNQEISYINHYIDFQKLKTEKELEVSFDYSEVDENIVIEPMILVPFIENAFKHSDIELKDSAYIIASLTTKNQVLEFKVVNTVSANEQVKDKTPGIGIENVLKRLELAYQNKYHISTVNDGNNFEVNLKLFLQ